MTLHEGKLKFAGVNTSAAEMLSMLLTASDAVMDEHSTAGKTLN
jgi:hypothetical protein